MTHLEFAIILLLVSDVILCQTLLAAVQPLLYVSQPRLKQLQLLIDVFRVLLPVTSRIQSLRNTCKVPTRAFAFYTSKSTVIGNRYTAHLHMPSDVFDTSLELSKLLLYLSHVALQVRELSSLHQ